MTVDFRTIRIADFGRVITGKTPPSAHPEFFGDIHPFLTPTDIDGFSRHIEPDRFLSTAGRDYQHRLILPSRAVCVVCIGATIGKVCMTDRPSFTNQQINSVLVNEDEHDPFFVYHLLTTLRDELKSNAGGAATPIINKTAFSEIKVSVPSLTVQQRIAGILSAYDELIENSQRRIKILESMARALHREWFVHLRFPGHQNYSRVGSSLGGIPQGWEVKKLGDLLNYSRRATKPGPNLDERRYIPIDCLPSKSLALLEARPIEEAQSSLQLFEKGDILFGAMRPYFHKVAIAPFAGVTRTTCFVFKPAQPGWHAFATMTAFDEETVAYANAHSQGATIPYAVWDGSLSEMPIVLPSPEVLERFEALVAPILSQLAQSFFVLGNLRRTRDLLLPRLLSGEIDFTKLKEPMPT
jgi:type I restriction enzyme S subunit